jgi:hypothetical protein
MRRNIIPVIPKEVRTPNTSGKYGRLASLSLIVGISLMTRIRQKPWDKITRFCVKRIFITVFTKPRTFLSSENEEPDNSNGSGTNIDDYTT